MGPPSTKPPVAGAPAAPDAGRELPSDVEGFRVGVPPSDSYAPGYQPARPHRGPTSRDPTRTGDSGRPPREQAPADCIRACDWLVVLTGDARHPTRGQLLYLVRVAGQDGGQWLDFEIYADCFAGLCVCKHEVGGFTTQLRPCRFFTKVLLQGEPDQDWEYILKGVVYGFRVVDDDCDSEYFCPNYPEVLKGENYTLMSAKLTRELASGAISVVAAPLLCTHALGCVPKGDGIRGIVDCSRPALTAVNNFTSQVAAKFKYNSVHDVTDWMSGKEFLSTLDISDAYRAVHTHPSSRLRQGLTWDFGEGMVCIQDNRLCMGLSSAPYCFSKISDFVVRALALEGVHNCVNYLDDFCIVTGTQAQGREDQRLLIRVLRHLGFNISYKKVSDPAQVTRFLGIEIDSLDMCLRLPVDKLERVQKLVGEFECKTSATKQELDELAGLLAHCSTVIKGGSTFTRRIYDLCATETRPYMRIHLTKEFLEDILWWKGFSTTFNGSSKIRSPTTPTLGLYSDSSFWGYGAYSNYDWLAGPWDTGNSWVGKLGHHYVGSTTVATDENINVLELFPILKAMERWGPKWVNSKVCCVTDNTQVMWAIRKGRSKNSFSMVWLREIFWLSVKYNFTLTSVYIASEDNTLCDSLSRLDLKVSVLKIQESMSSASMCCYQIFDPESTCSPRIGAAEEGVHRPAEAVHILGVGQDKIIPDEQVL